MSDKLTDKTALRISIIEEYNRLRKMGVKVKAENQPPIGSISIVQDTQRGNVSIIEEGLNG